MKYELKILNQRASWNKLKKAERTLSIDRPIQSNRGNRPWKTELTYLEEITMTCTAIIRLADRTMGNLYGTHITNNLGGHQSVSLHRYFVLKSFQLACRSPCFLSKFHATTKINGGTTRARFALSIYRGRRSMRARR